jgi:hypothetical protein
MGIDLKASDPSTRTAPVMHVQVRIASAVDDGLLIINHSIRFNMENSVLNP